MSRAHWIANIEVSSLTTSEVGRLARILGPEVLRTGRRAQSSLHVMRSGLRVRVSAEDTSAMRAALNTYLGWLHLAFATERAATAGTSPARTAGAQPRSASRSS